MDSTPGVTGPAPARHTITACRARGPIVLDGRLDEPDWRRAPVVDRFLAWDERRGRVPARSRTRARLLWDRDYLYIGAEMADDDLFALKTEPNDRTWEDDVFEVFIKPVPAGERYYELHVTPANVTLQLAFVEGWRGRGRWSDYFFDGGLRSAVTLAGTLNDPRDRDEGWTVEIAVPFAAFRAAAPPPGPGTAWTIALCRYDYSYYLDPGADRAGPRPAEASTSAVLSEKNFHLTRDYDPLIFTG